MERIDINNVSILLGAEGVVVSAVVAAAEAPVAPLLDEETPDTEE